MIHEAYFGAGLFKTIAVIVIFYYGFKLLSKYVFPVLFKRWVDKKMGQFQNQGGAKFNDAEQAKDFVKKHEGEVKIKTNTQHKTETKDFGEEVDFEEVE